MDPVLGGARTTCRQVRSRGGKRWVFWRVGSGASRAAGIAEGNLPAIAKNAVVGYSVGSERGTVPVMVMTVESMEDAGMITAGAGLTEVVAGTTERYRTR